MRAIVDWITARVTRIFLSVAERFLAHWAPHVHAWEPIDGEIPGRLFGAPDDAAIERYLAGMSTVDVASLEEVQAWLLGCRYEPTHEFRAAAAWESLPFVFEYVRRGDCMDHALWAWRKLRELGEDVDLVVGCPGPSATTGRHAWVVLRRGNESFLFETVAKTRGQMIRPLGPREGYLPEFGIDRRAQTFAFWGIAHVARANRAARIATAPHN